MKIKIAHILLLTIAAVAYGCSTTKRIADGEVLYTGVRKMRIEGPDGDKLPSGVRGAVQEPLSVRPNNPLFSPYVRTPVPTGLWVWNYFYTDKDHGLKHWIYQRLAKEPVLISGVDPDNRTTIVEQILANHGYFGSDAGYEIIPKKNPKKARISYFVTAARPWHFTNVEFPQVNDPATARIDSLRDSSLIRDGGRFDVDTLTAERVRITNALRDESFYYFRPDYLVYFADTLGNKYDVALRMQLAAGTPEAALQPYNVGDMTVNLYNPTGGDTDSLMLGEVKVRYQHPLRLRPAVLDRRIAIRPGEPAVVGNIDRTLTNLTKLGIFRYVNMSVTPLDSLGGTAGEPIDMTINAQFDAPLEAEFEADFSSKSNSFIGPGIIFGVRHKNAFRGGEQLSFRFNGSYEWQTGNTRNQLNSSAINSYEVGFTASVSMPRLLVPRFIDKRLTDRYDSRTVFQLGADLLNRPKFFTIASFNGSMAYEFQTSPYSYHNFTIFRVVYSHLLRTTEDFKKIIDDNPVVAQSFENQLIPSMAYTYTFNKPYGRHLRHRLIWQSTVTSAGNLLYGLYSATGASTPMKIFGIPFSQFVKGVTELKFYYGHGQFNTWASRLLVGAGYAYGNSSVLPYSEQFYIGGANSIRAFTIRSLGPGSYHPDANERYGYYDQTGELKIEINTEYRFKIIGNLYGAAFVDAGNVWLLRKDRLRPGGQINIKEMWREIALGTGAGLRFDITYLVIRADLGIGLHLPYDTGRSGYYNIPRFKDGLGFQLAIGYPF